MTFLQKCSARSSQATALWSRYFGHVAQQGFRNGDLFEARARKVLSRRKLVRKYTDSDSALIQNLPVAGKPRRSENLVGRSTILLTLLMVLATIPHSAAAEVIISEIMYDVPGSDSKAEWVEIQNTGDSAVDLTKWKFNDGSNHTLNAPPKNGSTGSLLLGAGEYMILASNASIFSSAHSVSVSVIDTVMNLTNDKASISLLNASSTVENKVSYSSSRGGNGTGESLQLIKGKFVHAIPTPGTVNSAARAAKTATVSAPRNSSKKTKTIAKAEPEILDGTSTVATEIAETDVPTATSAAMLASAVVPLGSGSSPLMPYLYGVLALGITGAGAVFVAKQKKKGEWEIEEIA